MERMTPAWLDQKGRIDERLFCEEFLNTHSLCYSSGQFHTPRGPLASEQRLQQEIYQIISTHVTTGLAKKVDALVRALRLAAWREPLDLDPDRVHFANGDYHLRTGSFQPSDSFCRNRLAVNFAPDAPEPGTWLAFLETLLEPEDILTLQEYLGYCMIPSNKAQKMLMLIGKGGEGKSRIGLVMGAIFAEHMNTGSIQKVEVNRFARADLEGKLLMVDDDMDLAALPKTNYIKTIITAEAPIDIERKGIQSYQSRLYARFLCFGNGALTSLYDRSNGFYRRQMVLTTKDKPQDRRDDPYLAEKLIREKEAIALWMLSGLLRLMGQDFQFTISSRSRRNVEQAASSAENTLPFLSSQGYVLLRPEARGATKDLYAAYRDWCEDNAEVPLSMRSFATSLSQKARDLGLTPCNHIPLPSGKFCRGYVGITRA